MVTTPLATIGMYVAEIDRALPACYVDISSP
jgi:hypothetical protein